MSFTPIANYEEYGISENGEVYSEFTGKILTPVKNPNGYLKVSLRGNKQVSIHRLVAKHFLPNPYDYKQVNHKDGNKENNHFSNLEWCTCADNAQHALKTGLRSGYVSTTVKKQMLERTLNGELIADLALEIGNHPNTLSRMLRIQAQKDGREDEWKNCMRERRKRAAIRNLEIINNPS